MRLHSLCDKWMRKSGVQDTINMTSTRLQRGLHKHFIGLNCHVVLSASVTTGHAATYSPAYTIYVLVNAQKQNLSSEGLMFKTSWQGTQLHKAALNRLNYVAIQPCTVTRLTLAISCQAVFSLNEHAHINHSLPDGNQTCTCAKQWKIQSSR